VLIGIFINHRACSKTIKIIATFFKMWKIAITLLFLPLQWLLFLKPTEVGNVLKERILPPQVKTCGYDFKTIISKKH